MSFPSGCLYSFVIVALVPGLLALSIHSYSSLVQNFLQCINTLPFWHHMAGESMDHIARMECWRSLEHVDRILVPEIEGRNKPWIFCLASSFTISLWGSWTGQIIYYNALNNWLLYPPFSVWAFLLSGYLWKCSSVSLWWLLRGASIVFVYLLPLICCSGNLSSASSSTARP